MWAKWIIVNYVRIWGIVTWNVNELFLSMRWLESPTKLFNAIRCARCYSKHWAYNNKIMLSTKQWRIQKKMQLTYKKNKWKKRAKKKSSRKVRRAPGHALKRAFISKNCVYQQLITRFTQHIFRIELSFSLHSILFI